MYRAHRVVRSARTVAIVRVSELCFERCDQQHLTMTSLQPQATRKLATAPPPPPPLPTGPKASGAPPPPPLAEPKASKAPWIITGLAVLGGAGYYYTRTTGQEEDIEKKARELEHAARVKAGKAFDEGKAKVADVKASQHKLLQEPFVDESHRLPVRRKQPPLKVAFNRHTTRPLQLCLPLHTIARHASMLPRRLPEPRSTKRATKPQGSCIAQKGRPRSLRRPRRVRGGAGLAGERRKVRRPRARSRWELRRRRVRSGRELRTHRMLQRRGRRRSKNADSCQASSYVTVVSNNTSSLLWAPSNI